MPVRNKPTWIAVMDGQAARFFVLRRAEQGQIFEEITALSAVQKRRPSDKPGRFFSATGGRQAGEPDKRDNAPFCRAVAEALDAAALKKRYELLVLVAPPRFLADLHAVLPPRVTATLAHQIPKNLMGLSTEALWQKLSAFLLKAAKPVTEASIVVPRPDGASLPVSVVFRNMESSVTAEAEAVKHAAKLSKQFSRIQNCRVTVEAPKHEHRKVREFRVAVAMKLPGREIAIRPADGPAHADLSAAMREAFAMARRQLEGQVTRVKEVVMRERRRSSPRLRGYAEA